MHKPLFRAAALGVATAALAAGTAGATAADPGPITGHWFQRGGGEVNITKTGNTKHTVANVHPLKIRNCEVSKYFSLTKYAPDLFAGTLKGDFKTSPCNGAAGSLGIWTLSRNAKGSQRLRVCVYPASKPRSKGCITLRRKV